MELNNRTYTLIELIEILTGYIGDFELKFLKEIEREGLTAKMLTYLFEIHKLGNPTFTELARDLGLSKPSVTAIVDKLEGLGFIKRVKSDEDRRTAHIHVTKKGDELSRIHDRVHQNIADIFAKNLNKGDLNRLVELLNKVIHRIGKNPA